MIPTAHVAAQLDRSLAAPTLSLSLKAEEMVDMTAHRLEQHLLSELSPITRDRAGILMISLDKLVASPMVDTTPTRVLGRSKDPSALVQFAKDMAVWVKRTFKDAVGDDRETLLALLATRRITIGPKGKDALGRSTYVLQTPYGRFLLD